MIEAGRRVLTTGACVLVVIGAGVAVPAVAQAAPVSRTVTYTCPFPLIGNQTVVVATTADLPDAVATGGPIAVTGLISQITFPDTATQGFTLVGATRIDGTATRALGFTGADPASATAVTPIPSTAVPGSGAFAATTGPAPAVTATAGAPGTAEVSLGSLTMTLTPRRADGTPTGLGTFDSACTAVSGQDLRLGSVPIDPPPNTPPTAAPDAYTTGAGTALTVPAPGVLGNDADAEAGPLTAALSGAGPANGTLALQPDGSLTYTPAGGFSGTDSFAYVASDGAAPSAPATVTITVTPATPVPQRADLSATLTAPSSVARGETFTVTLTVRNDGPAPARAVGSGITVPLGLRVTGAGGGIVTGGGRIVAFVDRTLGVGEQVVHAVRVTADRPAGDRRIAAGTASLLPDPDLRDNAAVRTVTVR